MGRSLQIQPDRIDRVKSIVNLRGFPSQSALAMELGLSRATVSNYLNGKPVDYLNFVEISEKLGLSWLEISLQDEPVKRDGILVKKKVFSLNRELRVNFKDLFKALTKAIADLKTGNISKLPGNLIDALYSVDLDLNSPTIAWLLIFRSLNRAIFSLVKDNQNLFSYQYKNFDAIEEIIELSLEAKEIVIDRSFFNHPKELSILKDIEQPLKQWLQLYGLNQAQATSIYNRLPSYFVFALNNEWRERQSEYYELYKYLATPFSEVGSKERSWLGYSAWLQKQVDEPMFAEAFSLKQVYVEPLAYYEKEIENNTIYRDYESSNKKEKQSQKTYQKIVVDLADYLDGWLIKSNKDDAIRIISGDPGAGKSSFAKMFAARQAEKQQLPVLFIPLHHFDPTGDLVEAISKFTRDDEYLSYNLLDGELKESRLLIIFDGLDELSMQGKIGAGVARSFISEVQKTVSRINYRNTHLQVIISGRPIAISSNKDEFRKAEQILHILPYFVPRHKIDNYDGNRDLLEEDRRNIWWRKYGEATGKNYKKMPIELEIYNLFEITIQPLLNYLIALSYTRSINPDINIDNKIIFSEDTNINTIYEDLLKSVHRRGWDKSQRHPALKGIKCNEFIRILEEIALATWHGNGRTTTVKAIQSYCEGSGLKKLLAIFTKDAEAGVTNLLTAFYFRQSSYNNEGDRAFEFTHKSFGEYLTARRIVRELFKINKQLKLREEDPDEGWDEKQALIKWVIICGTTALDEYLFDFIYNELALCEKEKIRDLQKTISNLTGYMLCEGMPLEYINPRLPYKEEYRQSRNAETALFIVLNACARYTLEKFVISTTIKNVDIILSFRKWVLSIIAEQKDDINTLILDCFSFGNFENYDFSNLDLDGINFYNSNLTNANFEGSYLCDTNFTNAKIDRANFENIRVLMNYTYSYKNKIDEDAIEREFFKNIDFVNGNLSDLNFDNADFVCSNFEWANFKWANFYGADFTEANLEKAIFDQKFIDRIKSQNET